jgi:ubiquinone/menaquinone biosynthesis C-methylase UbiE
LAGGVATRRPLDDTGKSEVDCGGMAKLSFWRRQLKRIHPEGIPWPGSFFYNALSGTAIFQEHYELVAKDILNYCAQGSLLDIGTGPGWLLVKLHQQAPSMQLVGIDSSPSMVTEAQRNMVKAGVSGTIEIKEGNASQIPFDGDSFDIVVSQWSIHHWKHPVEGLNEVYRVLKPGGYALMYDLVSDTPAGALEEIGRKVGRFKIWLFWLHGFEEPFYSRENYEALASSTLFKEGRTQFVGILCCLIMKKG